MQKKMKTQNMDTNKSCLLCSKPFPITEQENGRKVKILVTPCNHLFHRICLRNWLRIEEKRKCCPHCKRCMEWRDATPLGKESNSRKPKPTARTNWPSDPEVTVQSLEAEVRHRKAQELLQRKEDAERAKRKISEQQRAETLQRRRLRREARNNVQVKQTRKTGRNLLMLLVLISGVSLSIYVLLTDKNMEIIQQENATFYPIRRVVSVHQRFKEVGIRWQRRLEEINRRIQQLEEEIKNSDLDGLFQNELMIQTNEIMEKKANAEIMVSWFNSKVPEVNMALLYKELMDLIDLANKGMDSPEDLKEFEKKNNKLFGEPNESNLVRGASNLKFT